MKRLGLSFLLATVPMGLCAQAAPAWNTQVGAIWSQPKGDLAQVATNNGWGVMLGTQAQETPQGAVRLFLEYRRFKTDTTTGTTTDTLSISDAGFVLTGAIAGPIYGFIGTTAERINLPNRGAATKLGARGGLGWALGTHATLEATYTTASLDHQSINSLEASLIFTF